MAPPVRERDLELLSAYLDDQLPPAEKARLEQRLRTEPELKETLAGLRATVRAMRDLPQLKVPRNFTLDPKVYGSRRPAPAFAPAYGFLRLATALATVLFVVTVAGDFLARSGARTLAVPAPALAPAPAEQAVAPTDTPEIAALAAPADAAATEEVAGAVEAPAEGPTEATGFFLEGPGQGGGGGGGGPGIGGGGGEGLPPAAPELSAEAELAAPAEGTPSAARQGEDTIAESETPEAEATPAMTSKAAPSETPPALAQAEALPATVEVEPEAAAVATVQPFPWLRAAQVALGVLAVALGLATLWLRSRR